MIDNIGKHYLETSIETFRGQKLLAEKAIAQLSDEELHWSPDAETNSVAVIMKHIAGNAVSRWTDFLTTDGEKPDRDRDSEFVDATEPRQQIMDYWQMGWDALFGALEPLTERDIAEKMVLIRGEHHTIVQALNRQISHYAYHVGQIVFLAKQVKRSNWKTLSIARGESKNYAPASSSDYSHGMLKK